ncbi:MAG: hypothetical protein A2Y02_02675 [Omnitrophica bacterium GWA2_52_12]|nr:MAG: hypothetical protein A2Y02_02675 [Omnitrophica bacterium GWA2_52_12]
MVIPRKAGQPTQFLRNKREKIIEELLEIATVILLKSEGHQEIKKARSGRHLRHLKARGLERRAEKMLAWASSLKGPIVYIFWRGRKCLYVGKGKNWSRLRAYDKSAYLIQATCLEVFCLKTSGQLGKVECLATHLFKPLYQKVKPAKVKWGKDCPVCEKHDLIRAELKSLFKMK